jgi:hypothetical protein
MACDADIDARPMAHVNAVRIFISPSSLLYAMNRLTRQTGCNVLGREARRAVEKNLSRASSHLTNGDDGASGGDASGGASPNGGGANPSDGDASPSDGDASADASAPAPA